MMSKKTVFLTGASGNMGYAGFKEIYKRKDKYNLVLLSEEAKRIALSSRTTRTILLSKLFGATLQIMMMFASA